jgi:3-oxo-5-alpha-steroid 4-dehydrogenase 1
VNEPDLFRLLVTALYLAAAASFVALLFVTAPYGRHVRSGWGPTVTNRLGWILMESPAVFFFAAVYSAGDLRSQPVPLVLLGAWMLHYVHRALVYPFLLRSGGRRMPLSVVAMGFCFNVVNAWLNARWISHLGPYSDGAGGGRWLWVGLAVFVAGLTLNRASDRSLLRLRDRDESGYSIPRGGAFRWVSCPNYLGEIIEWLGWALASRSPAALAFAVFTAANLVPRAVAHHGWYRANFPDYPAERKAVVPYLL